MDPKASPWNSLSSDVWTLIAIKLDTLSRCSHFALVSKATNKAAQFAQTRFLLSSTLSSLSFPASSSSPSPSTQHSLFSKSFTQGGALSLSVSPDGRRLATHSTAETIAEGWDVIYEEPSPAPAHRSIRQKFNVLWSCSIRFEDPVRNVSISDHYITAVDSAYCLSRMLPPHQSADCHRSSLNNDTITPKSIPPRQSLPCREHDQVCNLKYSTKLNDIIMVFSLLDGNIMLAEASDGYLTESFQTNTVTLGYLLRSGRPLGPCFDGNGRHMAIVAFHSGHDIHRHDRVSQCMIHVWKIPSPTAPICSCLVNDKSEIYHQKKQRIDQALSSDQATSSQAQIANNPNTEGSSLVRVKTKIRNGQRVISLAISHDGFFVFVICANGAARFFSTKLQQQIAQYQLFSKEQMRNLINISVIDEYTIYLKTRISPCGNFFIFLGPYGGLFHLESGKRIHTLDQPQYPIDLQNAMKSLLGVLDSDAAFLPDGVIVVAGGDYKVKFYRLVV